MHGWAITVPMICQYKYYLLWPQPTSYNMIGKPCSAQETNESQNKLVLNNIMMEATQEPHPYVIGIHETSSLLNHFIWLLLLQHRSNREKLLLRQFYLRNIDPIIHIRILHINIDRLWYSWIWVPIYSCPVSPGLEINMSLQVIY